VKWFETSWENLTPNQVHAMIRLRLDVFVVEQDCVYADLDGKDLESIHLWAESVDHSPGDPAEAVVRLLPPGVSYAEPSIGRVASKASQRGSGLGQELMERAVRACQRLWPQFAIRISAQQYLIKFYESIGFHVVGDGYMEDNIPHIGMVRPRFYWDEMIQNVSDAARDFEVVYRSVDQLNLKTPESSWGRKQVLLHLMTSEASLFSYMNKKAQADPASLPVCDLESDGRGVKLVQALRSDRRWKDPTNGLLSPSSSMQGAISEDDLISQWNVQRSNGFEKMKTDLSQDSWWSVQVFLHPMAGHISLYDTLAFMAAHIRHHIHQLNRLNQHHQSMDS
tara:strand:- start:4349 stop:5359 length:1011 start_codon:yes stop_codon:yes gene_type:complete